MNHSTPIHQHRHQNEDEDTDTDKNGGDKDYQHQTFKYQLNELYLRPLLDKHYKCKESIRYEDLIHSWKLVENWLQDREKQCERHHQQKDDKIESQMIVEVRLDYLFFKNSKL